MISFSDLLITGLAHGTNTVATQSGTSYVEAQGEASRVIIAGPDAHTVHDLAPTTAWNKCLIALYY